MKSWRRFRFGSIVLSFFQLLVIQPTLGDSVSFKNVTTQYKMEGYSDQGYGHGVAFADVDADGKLDVFSSNAIREQSLPDMLFINKGSWFLDEAQQRGVSDPGLTHSIVAADIDNDGDLDGFFANMSVYEDKHDGYGRNRLYENNGTGEFSDITQWAGISNELNDTRGAIALDINNDGWLDVYGVNWGQPNEMYVNRGTGQMQRVHRGADGPDGDTSAKQGVTAADFDNDGDIDIYVSRREADNWLFVNDGNGYFSERAAEYDVDVGGRTNGATFADINNDGDLDLFVVNYAPSGGPLPPLYVFHNNGDGTFTDKTEEYNITASAYSVSFGDVDNDADLDMFLLYNDEKQPGATPRVYLNNGQGQFSAITCGVEVPAKDARAAAFGDIDNDGDLDIYIACKHGHNWLLRNDSSNSNHYIDILCVGPQGDYGGFGSKVTVYEPGHLGNAARILGYQESVSNYAYLCQNQTALHFGLGAFSSCDVRIVRTDGRVFEYQHVAADQLFLMDEQPPQEYSLISISGENQVGAPGTVLEQPFVVRLVDRDGNGVANAQVTFSPQNGGHMIEPQPVTTDADGYARSTFVLGEEEGTYQIKVTSEKTGETTVIFEATAESPTSYSLHFISGDHQTALPGEPLAEPFVVRLKDETGTGVNNAEVTFSPQESGHMVEAQPVTTDAQGYAQSMFVLGEDEGDYEIIASCEFSDSSTVRFTAHAKTGNSSISIKKHYGDNQTGTVGKTLRSPCVVYAKDETGTPVPDVEILFFVDEGNGSLSGHSRQRIRTEADGKARAIWTLGETSGIHRLYAEYEETLLEFTAQAVAGSPAHLLDVSTHTEYVAAKSYDMACRLEDEFGNPASGEIRFEIQSGHGLVSGQPYHIVETDSNGIAATSWTLGPNHTYHNVLWAFLQHSPSESLRVVFDLNEVSPPSLSRSTLHGPQTVIADGADSAKLVIALKNEDGIALPDYPVEVQITGQENELRLETAASNSDGEMVAYLSSSTAEKKVITARVPGVGAVPDSLVIQFVHPPSREYFFEIRSGNFQQGVVNHTLPEPLVVCVRDEYDQPQQKTVRFAATHGDGHFEHGAIDTCTCDPCGMAAAFFTLGTTAGEASDSIKVSLVDAAAPPVYFVESALPDAPASLSKLSPDTSIIYPNESIELSAQISDPFGNPTPNVETKFYLLERGIVIATETALSDDEGLVHATVQAPQRPGAYRVKVQIHKSLHTVYTLLVRQRPEHLVYTTNDSFVVLQKAAHVILGVQCLNDLNEPAAGIPIQFVKVTGAGAFHGDSCGVSDENGRLSVAWQPSDLTNSTVIRAQSPQDSLYFYIRVEFGPLAVSDKITPTASKLGDNYPNPCNLSTTIPFTLAHPQHVTLVIFNINGERVRSLLDAESQAGEHAIAFDARDDRGAPLSSGFYFYQFQAGTFHATKRLLLLK